MAIKRLVVGILADRDVSQQSWTGQTLFDRLGKPIGDDDIAFAGLAGIFRADVFEHDQRSRDIFQLLADFVADAGPLNATIGASTMFGWNVMQDGLAGQDRRQWLAAVAILLGRI